MKAQSIFENYGVTVYMLTPPGTRNCMEHHKISALYPVYKITFFREKGLLPAKFFFGAISFFGRSAETSSQTRLTFYHFQNIFYKQSFLIFDTLAHHTFFWPHTDCKNTNYIFQIQNYGNFKTDFFLNLYLQIFLVK